MNGWSVRPARLDDVEAVVELEARAFGPASWGSASVADGFAAPNVATLIAFHDSAREAAAFVFWRSLGEEAEILSIGVAPRLRRRGGARALLGEVIERARGAGVRKLFLEVDVGNAAAAALYASQGFMRIGLRKRYYNNGGDALVMRLDL